jgi:hypothetical protein
MEAVYAMPDAAAMHKSQSHNRFVHNFMFCDNSRYAVAATADRLRLFMWFSILSLFMFV